MSSLWYSFSLMKRRPKAKTLQLLGERMQALIQAELLDPSSLSTVLKSMAMINFNRRELIAAIVQQLHSKMDLLRPLEVSSVRHDD